MLGNCEHPRIVLEYGPIIGISEYGEIGTILRTDKWVHFPRSCSVVWMYLDTFWCTNRNRKHGIFLLRSFAFFCVVLRSFALFCVVLRCSVVLRSFAFFFAFFCFLPDVALCTKETNAPPLHKRSTPRCFNLKTTIFQRSRMPMMLKSVRKNTVLPPSKKKNNPRLLVKTWFNRSNWSTVWCPKASWKRGPEEEEKNVWWWKCTKKFEPKSWRSLHIFINWGVPTNATDTVSWSECLPFPLCPLVWFVSVPQLTLTIGSFPCIVNTTGKVRLVGQTLWSVTIVFLWSSLIFFFFWTICLFIYFRSIEQILFEQLGTSHRWVLGHWQHGSRRQWIGQWGRHRDSHWRSYGVNGESRISEYCVFKNSFFKKCMCHFDTDTRTFFKNK